MKDVVENKTGSPGIQCLRREWAEVLASHYNAYCSRASATHFTSKFQNYTCALKSVQCLHPTRMKVSTNNLWECSKNIIYALKHCVKFKLSDLITWHKTTDFSLPFCEFSSPYGNHVSPGIAGPICYMCRWLHLVRVAMLRLRVEFPVFVIFPCFKYKNNILICKWPLPPYYSHPFPHYILSFTCQTKSLTDVWERHGHDV